MIFAENIFFCFAVPLCVALLFLRGGAREFCAFLLVGMGTCLLSAYINSYLVRFSGFSLMDAAVYIAPISEELIKLVPLLFFLLVMEPDSHSLFAASITVGIGFATFENSYYMIEAGAGDFAYVLVRSFAAGLMHTVCALAVGIGLTLIKKYGSMPAVGVLGTLATAVTYHAVYNLLVSVEGVSRVVGYAMPLVTIAAGFLLWKKIFQREEGRLLLEEAEQPKC